MGLLPAPHVKVSRGAIDFCGEDLTQVSERRLREIRGSEISMVFQEPMTALNPVMTIGSQIDEIFRFHANMSAQQRRQRAVELLDSVQLPDPKQIVSAYPHELSGGQRQRAMIAMALALEPKILIADEPTTALDVTTQAQILKLISDMQAVHKTGVLFITHDFGVVADIADRVAVMQYGRVVETGTVDKVLNHPEHPYTQALIASVPSLTPRAARTRSDDIAIETEELHKTFGGGRSFFGLGPPNRVVHAVKDVTVELRRGETLGIVGESGSGKSTLARCMIRLLDSDSGKIMIDGTNLRTLERAQMRPWRSKIQMVFQDPFASLNPRIKIGQIIAQGPMIQGASREEAEARTRELLGIEPPLTDWAGEEGIADEEMLTRLKEFADGSFTSKTDRIDRSTMQSVEKQVLLQVIDTNWREHLQHLDHLKSAVGWRSYGQRDPLNEYKSEAFTLFDTLLTDLREGVTKLLMNLQVQAKEPEPQPEPQFNPDDYKDFNPAAFAKRARSPQDMLSQGPSDVMGAGTAFDAATYEAENGRISRNANCPCGSGKKFKHCHGKVS